MNKKPDLSIIRRDYGQSALNEQDMSLDPIVQFERWFQAVLMEAVDDPTAMVLSTVDERGHPDSRVLLLKGIEQNGFVFYTNYNSAKGHQLALNGYAALNFYWPSMMRQVRVRGLIAKLSHAQSCAYFATRPRGSQIGAMASQQSQVILNRAQIEADYHALAKQYTHEVLPCPSHWGGYLLVPEQMEFWQGRDDRLHDRVQYLRQDDGTWNMCRLAP